MNCPYITTDTYSVGFSGENIATARLFATTMGSIDSNLPATRIV